VFEREGFSRQDGKWDKKQFVQEPEMGNGKCRNIFLVTLPFSNVDLTL
jgi:hypothetical protein